MKAYTKHITQLSTDGDWELSFYVDAETPEEAFGKDENKSTITKVYDAEIKFINKSGLNVGKLRGKVINQVWIDNVYMGGVGNPGNGDLFGDNTISLDLYTNDTLPGNPVKTNYIPRVIGGGGTYKDFVSNIIVNHDASGEGTVSLRYLATFSGSATMYATHKKIEFLSTFTLEPITVHGIPYTEMSDSTKQALINGSVAIRTRLIVNNSNDSASTFGLRSSSETLVLTEEDSVKTWELNDERYVPETGFIGQFVARTLNGELHNISDDFSIQDTDVELQIGIVELGTRYQLLTTENGRALLDETGNIIYIKDLGSDKTTWYSLGNFLVTKPEDDEVADNTRFEAFDYTTKFNVDFDADYVDSMYTTSFNNMLMTEGSVTLQWLASYTCAQVGIQFANESFTNSEFAVPDNQFTQGESCRDVMKAISEIAFGWCRIGWDNKCYIDEPQTIVPMSDDTNVLTNDNYYSLTTQKQIYGPITRIVIGMEGITGQESIVEDTDLITQYGNNDILIMNNPILHTRELREAAKEGGRKLLGLYYSPLETETPGHPWFNGNELIDIQDMEGVSRYTYPFNRTTSYTGHIKTKLVTPAVTAQEKETAYKQQLFKTVRDIGIKVDAQEGSITTINALTKANESGLAALTTKVENKITDTYSRTQIQEIINGTAEDGTAVTSVKTTAGTFDKNGLTIEQTGSLTKTNINSNGMIIYNTSGTVENDKLLDVNSDGVVAKNIKVSKYLNIGSHSRMEDYTHVDYTQGTGVFWIGSDY